MAQAKNWYEDYPEAGSAASAPSRGIVVQPGSPLKQTETEAGIEQKRAGAASSAASAREKVTLLPAKTRKAVSEAELAETKAKAAQIALEKSLALTRSRPTGEKLGEAQQLVLTELKNAAQARKMSREMVGASGFAQGIQYPGLPSKSVLALLAPIKANSAFSKLQEMRAASPTGGALGNVTEKELELLFSSEAAIDPSASDEVFQQGMDTIIRNRLKVASKLGVDPAELAAALGPDEIGNYASEIKAYRFVPEDVKALQSYVSQTKKAGTFDPSDFAALMGNAYFNATGRQPTADFMKHAVDTGFNLEKSKGASLSDFSYEQADADVQKSLGVQAGAEQKEQGWGEVLGGAALNFIPSTFELAYDTAKALTVDLPETVEGLAKVVGGATGLSDDTQYEALKQYYADRYGSVEGFKQALKTDPASIVADIAGLATGGATLLGKAASLGAKVSKIGALSSAARASEAFASAASKFDPLAAAGAMTKAGGKALGATGEQLLINAPARIVGATGEDVKQAFGAGTRGATGFMEQATGTGDVLDPITKAEQAVGELYQNRSRDYSRRMGRLKQSPEQLSFDDVEAALENVRSTGRHKGIDISAAGPVWDEIDAKYMEFFNKGLNSIEDFDAMKRAISEIGQRYQVGTPEHRVAKEVAKSINKTITEKAPIYANVMKDYRLASDTLSDVKASIGADAKSADTTLTKLMRASSGKGPRGRSVIDILESTKSGKGLGDLLAGRNLSSPEPRGVAPSMLTAGAAMSGSPELAAAALLSPRTLGTKAYELGEKYGAAQRGVQAAGRMVGADKFGPEVLDLISRYAAPTQRGVLAAQPVIQSQQDPFTAPVVPSEDQRKQALLSRYRTSLLPEMSMRERVPLALEQYAPREASAADLQALIQQYASTPEEEEEVPVVEEFARGGVVIAPSMY